MFTLSKFVRFYSCLMLALVLGTAGAARASHEGRMPAHLFVVSNGTALVGQNCLSPHVGPDGSPVAPVHIHACADCLLAIDEFLPIAPMPIVILQLVAPRRLVFDLRPPLRLASTERLSPHAARAPPLAS
jgi:hypothetical protein